VGVQLALLDPTAPNLTQSFAFQLAQVFPQLPPAQHAQIAQQFGMTPQQFGQMIQMM
jgi:hypothetical protein